MKEAPRLWYLRAKEVLLEAGFEEMQAAKACFLLRDPKTRITNGMLVLHVDDACFSGKGPQFERAMAYCRSKFIIGKEEYDSFTFLCRHVRQHQDFSIEVDQHDYVRGIQRVKVSKDRRSQPASKLNLKELHDYRSLTGQLAWPARETMPQLAYSVSDLQQKVSQATVGDLVHANNVLNLAKKNVEDGQTLRFPVLPENIRMEMQHSHDPRPEQTPKKERAIGFGAIHDASFMGQPRDVSQQAYALMLAPTQLYEGKALTHLIDWGSAKIHSKMRSTLACEASSAARAFDRGCFGRVMLYEIEYGLKHKWNRGELSSDELRSDWTNMCNKSPFAVGTDCR